MEMKVRTVMPPHYSPNLTFEQARAVWIAIEQEKREKRRRSRTQAAGGTTPGKPASPGT